MLALAVVAQLACDEPARRDQAARQPATAREPVPLQQDRLISAKGVGAIQLGMTLSDARNAAPAAAFTRTSDGEGVALVQVTVAPDVSMVVWAEEDDPDKPVDWTKRIRSIETFSAAFRTAEGAHPGAMVSDVHRLYGPTKTTETSEIESRRYITFDNQPAGLMFRLDETGRAIFSIAVSPS